MARIASASRSASSRDTRSRWSARRWALFCPMLGSRVSSSIRISRYFELYMGVRGGGGGSERHLEAEPAGELAHRLAHVGFRGALRFAHRRDDQVLEQRRVGILQRLGLDREALQHLLAVHHRGDDT